MTTLAITSALITLGMIAKLIIQDMKQSEVEPKIESMITDMNIEIDNIIERVAFAAGVSVDEMKSNSRKREIAVARQVSIYMIRNQFSDLMTWSRISALFNRDHTTGIYAYNAIEDGIKVKDPLIRKILERYEQTETQAA